MRTLEAIKAWGLMLWFVQCDHHVEEDTVLSNPFLTLAGLRVQRGVTWGAQS